MTTINPYLTFNGNCEEAFTFYKSVFGGEFAYLGRFNEMPSDPNMPPLSEAELNQIMHVALPISSETILMGSDTSSAFGPSATAGTNFSISVNTATKAETDRIFNSLSEGGDIKMPLNDTFWGSYFGMFTDRFGIHWMVSCDIKE
ncbi:VOC family protein [Aquimarina rhabdastrellae]